jgi:hypothetical protein
MYIEKAELINNMVRLQDGQTLNGNYVKYFLLLVRGIQFSKGESTIVTTLKYINRCEAMLDLEPIYEKIND